MRRCLSFGLVLGVVFAGPRSLATVRGWAELSPPTVAPSERRNPSQTSTSTPAPQPTFRGGVERVTLEATVVNTDGDPVTGLTAEDFTLRVGGRPRPVRSALFVSGGAAEDAAETAFPEFTTNELRPADAARPAEQRTPVRTVVLVSDAGSFTAGDERPVVNAAIAFVRGLPARDRVGLLTLPAGQPMVDVTVDHERVIKALPAMVGTRRPSDSEVFVGLSEAWQIRMRDLSTHKTVYERECELKANKPPNCGQELILETERIVRDTRMANEQALASLRRLFEGLAKVEGPKVVVLLSQGMAVMDSSRKDFTDLGAIAGRADIAIYALQMYETGLSAAAQIPMGFDFRADQLMLSEGLRDLAWASGATLLQQVGKMESAFDRVSREISARYVLSFDVEPEDRTGKPLPIELTVAKATGRLVRHRREFVWRPPAAPPATVQAETAAALATGATRSDLPLAVATFTSPDLQPLGQRTTLWLRIGGGQDRPASSTVRFEVLNEKNVRVATSSPLVQAPAGTPLDFVARMPLPPGRYVLRLAARDPSGRMGTIEHRFEARIASSGALSVGTLLVLDARAMAAGRSTLTRVLAPDDTAVHAFAETQAAEGFDWRTVSGTLEVRDARDGAVRVTVPLKERPLREPVRRGFEALVPVSGWPAGTYLLRATLTHGTERLTLPVRSIVLETVPPAPATSTTTAAPSAGTPGSTSASTPGSAAAGADAAIAAAAGVDAVVRRASSYADAYLSRLSSVVAEERYVQIVRNGPPNLDKQNVDEALEWRADNRNGARDVMDARRRRQLISDVLMVKTQDGAWTAYRDVAVVDGRTVGNRSKRALRLFTESEPELGAKLKKIADESSRYNLIRLGNFNVPALPLLVLDPGQVARFTFERAGEATIDNEETMVLAYRETRGPAFIHNRMGEDVFVSGRLWVASDGRVLRSELLMRDRFSGWSSQSLVSYRPVSSLGLLMPFEMWERHFRQDNFQAPYLEGRAFYANFRRFDVAVSESSDLPK